MEKVSSLGDVYLQIHVLVCALCSQMLISVPWSLDYKIIFDKCNTDLYLQIDSQFPVYLQYLGLSKGMTSKHGLANQISNLHPVYLYMLLVDAFVS